MMWLRKSWRHFWFEPALPLNLGLCRMIFFGALFLFYLPQDFSAWAEVSDVFWKPIGLFRHLHLPVLSENHLTIIQILWKVSLGLSCIGLFTRVSTVTSFILGIYLIGLPHNFGKIHHDDAILVFVLGILALSWCGDSWSVDQLILKARRENNLSFKCKRMSGEYTWPIRAIWLVMALIFFAAGTSKIIHSGIEWAFSDNLMLLFIQHNYYLSDGDPLTSWGLILAQYSWLCRMLAAATIVLETGYPMALFSSKARLIVVPSVFLMLVSIRVFMGPAFEQLMICNIFWVPWDRVVFWFSPKLGIIAKVNRMYL